MTPKPTLQLLREQTKLFSIVFAVISLAKAIWLNVKADEMKIFLSHSSKDKQLVRRINKALQAHHFDTWLDEEQIPFGGSIVEFVNRGLTEADVLVVFLSRHSVVSKWVETEWQAQFFDQVSRKNITVIPLLVSDCEIPKILKGRLYADFREGGEFEDSLAMLVGQLQRLRGQYRPDKDFPRYDSSTSILEYTRELLRDLEGEYISMPSFRRLSFVGTLKKMPRQGKMRRLAGFKPRVRVRTIYDHILSVAHSADCLLSVMNHKLPEQEFASLALCIAYHELNEVVLGDIPSFTSLGSGKNVRSNAEERLRGVPPSRREEIATDFVWLFLSEKHRISTEAVVKILKDEKSEIFKVFKLLDKIDPIISVWRYLHEYRGRLGPTPKDFNSAMKDFFDNPDIKAYIKTKNFDTRVLDLVLNLQDRRKAWDYYQSPNRLFSNRQMFEFDHAVVRKLIEGIPLFHTTERVKLLK